jgi:hypothetical protein
MHTASQLTGVTGSVKQGGFFVSDATGCNGTFGAYDTLKQTHTLAQNRFVHGLGLFDERELIVRTGL